MEGSSSSITSSWSGLETFSKIIGSMPYKGFRINVYKLKSHVPSSEDPPRYVYMPALLLNHCNPKGRRNQVSGRAELLFTVHMWDEELEAKVFEYVKETQKDAAVQPHQIQVIPFESVIVTSNAPSMQSSGWMSYQGIDKELNVAMTCSSMEDAHRLASEMKTDPSQFLPNLKVKFSLETQKVRRKETCINIEHVRDGELFGQLLQRYPEAETVLLTADGVERLISESLTKVVANSFDDNEVVTKDSVLYSKLRELIVDSQVTINEQSKGIWHSVFWYKDNYRPDRTARSITDVYNQSDDQSRSKLRDIFSGTSSNSVDVDEMLKDVVVCRRSDAESSKDRKESSDYMSNSSAQEQATFTADNTKSENKQDQEQNSNEKYSRGGSAEGEWKILLKVKQGDYKSGNGRASASKIASTDVQDRDTTNVQSSKTNNSKTSAGSRRRNKNIAKSGSSQEDTMTERKGAASMANQESFYDDQQKEELAKVLKNSKNYVEWTGEKFQPKPMSLTRVHLAKFTDRQTFQDTRVTVSYSSATLMTDLHLFPEGSCCSAQTKLLDTIKSTLLQHNDEIKAELGKHRELIDSLKPKTQKQIDEMKDNRISNGTQGSLISSSSKTGLESTNYNEEFKADLAKQVEVNNSLKLTLEKQIDEVKEKLAKEMEQKDHIFSTIQKHQNEETKVKFAKQIELNDALQSSIEKQNVEIMQNRESQDKLRASVCWGTTGFLWRIDKVAARMAKAEILESDEFYTGQYGYKLKAQITFNGWGNGTGTHLSIAFQLMPGDYDGLLEWPFQHSVTFTLYDQVTNSDQASNITEKFFSDDMPRKYRFPTSKCFWGTPKFVSHEILKQRKFIKRDVMFLNISFDP